MFEVVSWLGYSLPYMAMIGPDLAMIGINLVDQCTLLTEDGTSHILEDDDGGAVTLSETMYSVSILHLLCFCGAAGSLIYQRDWRDFDVWAMSGVSAMSVASCVGVFLSIPLFILWAEADEYGVNTDSCYGVLIAWPFVNLGALCIMCGLAVCVLSSD